MPKERPETATTYQEHFQQWRFKPKDQKARPKSTPANGLDAADDSRCPHRVCCMQMGSPHHDNRQIAVKRSKKCLHLHISNNYHVNIEDLPANGVGDIVNSYINGRMKAEGKPGLVVKKSTTRFKVRSQGNEGVKGKQVAKDGGKLFDPPWGYKGMSQKVFCIFDGCPKPAAHPCCHYPRQDAQKNPFTIVEQ